MNLQKTFLLNLKHKKVTIFRCYLKKLSTYYNEIVTEIIMIIFQPLSWLW